MVSPEGIKNYYNQLKQLVGSIQYTNDYEVHVALIQAPSYARTVSEKFYYPDKNIRQVLRHYVDLYGIMQKTTNALGKSRITHTHALSQTDHASADIVIEDAKQVMKQWGAANPDFLICNSKIGFQLNMTPERTQFITQGTDGLQRLRDGPEIDSYRGLRIINSRSFSLEAGMPPRDLLRRRVRVAEYYYIPYSDENKNRKYQFYDEGKDTFSTFSYDQLRKMAALGNETESPDKHDLLIIRPNIEHTMLGVIMGRGGLEQLGATYWGQTEMSCYDDSMFGKSAFS